MDEVKRIESAAAGWGLEGSWKWSARPRKRKNQRRCAVEGGSSDAFVFAVCSQQGRQGPARPGVTSRRHGPRASVSYRPYLA
jgi:hypothetical protein